MCIRVCSIHTLFPIAFVKCTIVGLGTSGLKIRRESANRFAWRFPSGPNSANPSGFAWGEDRGWQKKMKFSNSIQCCERSFNRSVTDRERRFPFSNLRFRLTVFFIVLSLNTEKHYSTTLNKVYLRNLRLKCAVNPALNCAVNPAWSHRGGCHFYTARPVASSLLVR